MSKITGHVQLKNWTPAIAARAARNRVRKIELLLQEISYIYGGVYEPVPYYCDLMREPLEEVLDAVNEAEELVVSL